MALKKKYNPLVKLGFDLYNEVEMPDLTNYFYNRYSAGDQLPIIVEHDMGGIEIQDINGDSFLYVGDIGNLEIGGTSTLIKSGHVRSVYGFYDNEIDLKGLETTFKQSGILYLNVKMYPEGVGFVEIPGVFKSTTDHDMTGYVNRLAYQQANGNYLIYSTTNPYSAYLAYNGFNGTPIIFSESENLAFRFDGDLDPFLERQKSTLQTTITDGGNGSIKIVSGENKDTFIELNAKDAPNSLKINSSLINLGNNSDGIKIENGYVFIHVGGNNVLRYTPIEGGMVIGDEVGPGVNAIYLSAAGIAHLKAQLGLA